MIWGFEGAPPSNNCLSMPFIRGSQKESKPPGPKPPVLALADRKQHRWLVLKPHLVNPNRRKHGEASTESGKSESTWGPNPMLRGRKRSDTVLSFQHCQGDWLPDPSYTYHIKYIYVYINIVILLEEILHLSTHR